MTNVRTKVEEMMAKVQSGEMTLEQALTAMANTQKVTQPRVDHIAEISGMNTLTELAVAYKKAAAKMSSAKRRAGLKYEEDPSYLKYKAEFELTQTRKNELYASVADMEDRVEAIIKIGGSDQAIIQEFLNQEKEILMDELLKVKTRKKLTNEDVHKLVAKAPATAPQELLDILENYREGLSEAYLSRNGNDQFVIKLNKLANLILVKKTTRKEVK